jgi:hypothetical protein
VNGSAGGGWEGGREREKRGIFAGECVKDPNSNVTSNGDDVVGGRDDGGFAMFYVAIENEKLGMQ